MLVTGEGDKPVTPALWRQKPFQVSHWFGMNMFVTGAEATGIPLGLGEPGAPKTLEWDNIQEALHAAPPRNKLLYSNFSTTSNSAVREPLRRWVNEPRQSWITSQDYFGSDGKQHYLQELLRHQFVLCPPGNGEDTHRMWEALYCGAVPVVRESPVVRQFPGLPMVIVKDFRQLAPDFLLREAQRLATEGPRLEYLWRDYWKKKFAEKLESIGSRPQVSWTEWLGSWMKEILRVSLRQ